MKRPHFALPEIYDDSLSYYDVLRKLIKSMHVINDNLNKIPEQIANEAKARLLGDKNLQHNITAEASAREHGDTTLQQNINSEATTRERADQEIREGVTNKISELKGELSNKLPKSPADWETWTSEEQAVARERIGIPGNYELIQDETITEDISQYTIDNISLKKAIIKFISVHHTSDNYLLVNATLDAAVNADCATVKSINKNGFAYYYYAYCEEGLFHNLSVGPVRPNGSTTNNLNMFSELHFAEKITAINLSAYTSSEVIPAGCRIIVYGVRA